MPATADIGLIGLAVMGENLALNIESRGFTIAVFNRTTTKVEIPDLDFRVEKGEYEGAANLPPNPLDPDVVGVAQANSKLLSVARDEADLG